MVDWATDDGIRVVDSVNDGVGTAVDDDDCNNNDDGVVVVVAGVVLGVSLGVGVGIIWTGLVTFGVMGVDG